MHRAQQQNRLRIDQRGNRLRGNLGKAYELFGDRLQIIIADMNKVLTA